MTDEQAATAVKTALTSANARPYDVDSVPATATDYTELDVTRRFGGNPRKTSVSGVVGYRITTRAVGRTVANAREIRKRQHAALEDVSFTIDGKTSTPTKFETATNIDSDDGWFTGLTTWTFAL